MRPILIALCLMLPACGQAMPRASATADEQHLLDLLRIDRFVEITGLHRESDGALRVDTRQGDVRARYRIASELHEGKPGLTLRRIDDGVRITVADDGVLGTGPEPHGLR